MGDDDREQSVVEFQRHPTRYVAEVPTVLGREVHDLVSQIELPKPAAASLRRAKKIAPVKMSCTELMGRIAIVQSAILASDDDRQREIGYRIGQILTEVGFTNYTVYEPISTMSRMRPMSREGAATQMSASPWKVTYGRPTTTSSQAG